MYLDRILYPIETLGPGKRIVVWTRGCSKHCFHCANPELWETEGAVNRPAGEIAKILLNICADNPVDGITFTGGDPLEQGEELLQLVNLIKPRISDVLVYTGYTVQQLQLLYPPRWMEEMKQLFTVLIDGPYVESENTDSAGLRGSSNQNIYYFAAEAEARYEAYMQKGRKIQNVLMGNKLISVGIHNRRRQCDAKHPS